MKVIFASKSEIGKKYLTKNNFPVEVVKVGDKQVTVKSLSNGGREVKIDAGDILRPYDQQRINPDARLSAVRSANGALKVRRLKKALSRVGERRTIRKIYKDKELVMTVNAEGFHVGGKTYKSLTAAAQGVTGTKITTGPLFWGFGK